MIGRPWQLRKVLTAVALGSLLAVACGDDDDHADPGKAGAAGSEAAGAPSGDAGTGNSSGKGGSGASGGTTGDAGTSAQVPEGGMGGAPDAPDDFSAFVHELIQKQTSETGRPLPLPELTDAQDEHGHYQVPAAAFDDLL